LQIGRPIDSAIPMAKSVAGFQGRGIAHQNAEKSAAQIVSEPNRVRDYKPESPCMLITRQAKHR
jgi:hypothetical protein